MIKRFTKTVSFSDSFVHYKLILPSKKCKSNPNIAYCCTTSSNWFKFATIKVLTSDSKMLITSNPVRTFPSWWTQTVSYKKSEQTMRSESFTHPSTFSNPFLTAQNTACCLGLWMPIRMPYSWEIGPNSMR